MTKLIGKIVSVCFKFNYYARILENLNSPSGLLKYFVRSQLFRGNRSIMKWFS